MMSKPKERPIIFSGEMVRAILDGRKTQTRRVIKKPERLNGLMLEDEAADWCPYGRPGDLLYVREAHQLDPPHDGAWNYYLFDAGSGGQNIDAIPERFRSPEHVIYRATDDYGGAKWRPSIHMPKWAARIWLEVTAVRVERVKSIHYADARAEGVFCASCNGYHDRACTCKRNFRKLWDSINAKRGYGWEENPWVWVVKFRRVKER